MDARLKVHLGMPDQRNSLLDRLGPDESLALRRAVLIGGDGVGEKRHRVRMREGWLPSKRLDIGLATLVDFSCLL